MKTTFLCILLFCTSYLPGQWVKLDGPYEASARDFAGANDVIYACVGKICYASEDKGAHWSPVSDFPFYPGKISAGNEETLFAMPDRQSTAWPDDWPRTLWRQSASYGDWEAILDTTFFEFPSERILSFEANHNNVIVGTNLHLYYSLNRGDTWSRATSELVAGVYEIIVASDNLFFARDGWRIHRSLDKGATWEVVYQGATYLYDISWSGAKLYGFTQTLNQLICGSNLGENWETLSVDSLSIYPNFNNNVRLATWKDSILLLTSGGCQHGGITNYLSHDGGNSWRHFKNNIGANGISLLEQYGETILGSTSGQGVCIGNYQDGRLKASSEGISAPYVLNTFVLDSIFWVDTRSNLWRSDDKGQTWEKSRNWEYPCISEDKVFVSAGELYFFDIFSQTLDRYDKSQHTWTNIPFPFSHRITSAYGNATSIFLQWHSQIWRSLDAGLNWTQLPDLPFYYSLRFSDDNDLWTSSYASTDNFYFSTDQGQTWNTLADPRPYDALMIKLTKESMTYRQNATTLAYWQFQDNAVSYFSPILIPEGDTLNVAGFFTEDESGFFWLAHPTFGLLFSADEGHTWQVFHAPLADERTNYLYVNGPYMFAATAQGLLLYDNDDVPQWPENENLTLQLLPNPNAGAARLRCSKYIELNTRFSLLDVSGKLVHTETLHPGQEWEIRTTGLPAGAYYGYLLPVEPTDRTYFLSVKWLKF